MRSNKKRNNSKAHGIGKWTLVCVGLIILCGISAYIAISSTRLNKIGYRPKTSITLDDQLKSQIKADCQSVNDIDEIIRKCNDIVCSRLSFAYRNDIPNGKANCIGYALLSSSVLNYAFRLNSLPCKARPVYGKAYLWDIDLHPFMKSLVPDKYDSFFNDHDYVEIDCGDHYIYTDASLQDLTGIEYFRKSY